MSKKQKNRKEHYTLFKLGLGRLKLRPQLPLDYCKLIENKG